MPSKEAREDHQTTRVILPFGDNFYHLFIVRLGMVYGINGLPHKYT